MISIRLRADITLALFSRKLWLINIEHSHQSLPTWQIEIGLSFSSAILLLLQSPKCSLVVFAFLFLSFFFFYCPCSSSSIVLLLLQSALLKSPSMVLLLSFSFSSRRPIDAFLGRLILPLDAPLLFLCDTYIFSIFLSHFHFASVLINLGWLIEILSL